MQGDMKDSDIDYWRYVMRPGAGGTGISPSSDTMFLVYAMRRVACPSCGVKVERVPWATGKHALR